MTTTMRQHDLVRAPRAAAREIVVRWAVSPDALRLSPGAAALNGHAARMTACALVWVVDVGAGRAGAFLEIQQGPASVDRLPLEGLTDLSSRVERDEETGLETLTASDAMTLVLRAGKVVYARTSVLSGRLGLGGGVYDGPN